MCRHGAFKHRISLTLTLTLTRYMAQMRYIKHIRRAHLHSTTSEACQYRLQLYVRYSTVASEVSQHSGDDAPRPAPFAAPVTRRRSARGSRCTLLALDGAARTYVPSAPLKQSRQECRGATRTNTQNGPPRTNVTCAQRRQTRAAFHSD